MAAAIEVLEKSALSYTPGVLKDIKNDQYLVDLGKPAGEQWVNWALVREAPAACAEFVPELDSIVEAKKTGGNVWYEARVKSVKGGFTVVSYLGPDLGEEIVEFPDFRPAYSRVTPARSRPLFVKQIFQLTDPKVHQWFKANEQRVVSDVCNKSRVISLVVERNVAQIRILGTEKAIANAKMLIELHGKHVSDMQRVYSEREQLSAKLQQERDRLTTGCRLDFPIERELIGLVVGKNGATIQAARKATGVHRVEVDPDGPRVVIIGPTQESIEAAREMLEFVTQRVSVKPEQIGWLIGRNGRNFRELQEKTKVTRLNIDKSCGQVVLVGTKGAVEAALLYMDTHLQYLSDFESEARESEKLRRELRGMAVSEEDPPYLGGKGGRGGKGAKGEGRGAGVSGRGGAGSARGSGSRGAANSTAKHTATEGTDTKYVQPASSSAPKAVGKGKGTDSRAKGGGRPSETLAPAQAQEAQAAPTQAPGQAQGQRSGHGKGNAGRSGSRGLGGRGGGRAAASNGAK